MNEVPAVTSHPSDEAIGFALDVVDASHVATRLEALLVQPTGRPRTLPLRALLVALLLLALDDRALDLKAATRVLYSLGPRWRDELGVVGEADTNQSLLARYRCVRYLFHLALSVMDPSTQVKNRVVAQEVLDAMAKDMDEAEIALRRQRLEGVVNDLLEASVRVCAPEGWRALTARSDSTPPWSRCSPGARRRARGRPPVTPTEAGTCARAITATSWGPRERNCASCSGPKRPPS